MASTRWRAHHCPVSGYFSIASPATEPHSGAAMPLSTHFRQQSLVDYDAQSGFVQTVMGYNIISNPNHRYWRLDNCGQTCVFGVVDRGVPELVYWGSGLPADSDIGALCGNQRRPSVPGAFDTPEAVTLLPETGTAFYGSPALTVQKSGKQILTQLELIDVVDYPNGLGFVCSDALAMVTVRLVLTLHEHSGVLSFDYSIHNDGEDTLAVTTLASAVLPLPAAHCEVESLSGRWAQEFTGQRERIGNSALVRSNRSGRGSQILFPGLLTGTKAFCANSGNVIAVHLGWSGNHELRAARTRDGQPVLQAAALLTAGEVCLERGKDWHAPTVYCAQSEAGYNGCVHAMHEHVRRYVLPRTSGRPVHFNTWEACYFDQSEARTLQLVTVARDLGAERFVLDDGWFKGRVNDRSGLGDWTACPEKYPNGLEPVFDAVRAAGMQAGLWIEPEMANLDSDLLRSHPDWLLGEQARTQPVGRHQYALNLCLPEVFDYLLSCINALVDRYALDYLKWDMNRDLSHVVVDTAPANEAISKAALRLIAAVQASHPELDIEICASGGARADYAMLSHGHRIWTSDNHDPHDRQNIQTGFSLFFPPEVMGSHVGSARSEITHRQHDIGFRIATAIYGHFGIEPTRDGLPEHEADAIRSAVRWYQRHREWLHRSKTWFIDHPEPGMRIRLLVSDDQSLALVSVALLATPVFAAPAPIRLHGLKAAAWYRVSLLDIMADNMQYILSQLGGVLMQAGFRTTLMAPDSACLYLLEKVQAS